MSCPHFVQLATRSLGVCSEGKEWESYNWTSTTSLTALFLFWIHLASLAFLLSVGVSAELMRL